MSEPKFNIEVAGTQQPDKTWLCACGKSLPTALALYFHRRDDQVHQGEQQ